VTEKIFTRYLLVNIDQEIKTRQSLGDDQEFPPLVFQSRDFGNKEGAIEIKLKNEWPDWRNCENRQLMPEDMMDDVSHNPSYYIKREPKGKNLNSKKDYIYYVVLNEADDQAKQLSSVRGTKQGTCQLGETKPATNKNCGFQKELLKQCFLDRGKQKGFDPTKGNKEWSDKEIAKTARAECTSIVQFDLNHAQQMFEETSYALAAAQETKLNLIFSDKDKDPNSDMKSMFVSKVSELVNIYPMDKHRLEDMKKKKGADMGSLLNKLYELYFCSWTSDKPDDQKKKAEIISKNDPSTKTILDRLRK